MKTLFGIIAFSLLAAVNSSGQNTGETAPDFTLSLLGGGDFTLSEQAGKVVVIFFMGYNCPACISAAPGVQSELYTAYANRDDYTIIGIDVYNGNESSLNSFKEQTNTQYPLAFEAAGVGAEYGLNRDRLVVVDKNGILRHKGSTNAANDIENVKAVVNEYLNNVTSIYNRHYNSARVYPTIAQQSVTIIPANNKEAGIMYLEIYTVNGSTVFSQTVNASPSVQLNVSALHNGVYFVKISNNRTSYMGKFIKQ